MRGKKARMLRRVVYGEETHRQRSYYRDNSTKRILQTDGTRAVVPAGVIIADKKRRVYKHIKSIYTKIHGLSFNQLENLSNELKA